MKKTITIILFVAVVLLSGCVANVDSRYMTALDIIYSYLVWFIGAIKTLFMHAEIVTALCAVIGIYLTYRTIKLSGQNDKKERESKRAILEIFSPDSDEIILHEDNKLYVPICFVNKGINAANSLSIESAVIIRQSNELTPSNFHVYNSAGCVFCGVVKKFFLNDVVESLQTKKCSATGLHNNLFIVLQMKYCDIVLKQNFKQCFVKKIGPVHIGKTTMLKLLDVTVIEEKEIFSILSIGD